MPADSMHHLHKLWQRPYFTRCWCIQEVQACKDAVLKCENLEMPFMDVAGTVFVLAQWLSKVDLNNYLYLWWRIHNARQQSPLRGQSKVESSLGDLLELLDSTRAFQATDARDKIFALQGVSDEGLQPVLAGTQIMGDEGIMLRAFRRGMSRLAKGINSLGPGLDVGRARALRPNYRKPALEVYIDVTRYMLRKSPRVLDVLTHVMHHGDPEGGEYPSWVPKWFEPKTVHVMRGGYLAGFCDGHFRYFAQVHDNPITGNSQFPRVLSIDGFRVDVIQGVSEPMVFNDASDLETFRVIEKTWSQVFPFPLTPRSSQRYRGGFEPIDLAFFKVVSAYPFGDMIGLVSESSRTGLDMSFPANFESQFLAITKDGGRRETLFLEDLARHRAENPHKAYEPSTEAAKYFIGARVYASNRRVFVTPEGRLGLGPQVMQPGDEIVVLFGGRMPFVIRPRGDHHIFIGQCLILDDQVMSGKITEMILRQNCGPPRVTFHLR